MPGYSPTAAVQALDSLGAALTTPTNVISHVQLNTADPGTTGANESTATRQACSWNGATLATRQKTNSTSLTFTGQASGTAITHFSTWSAATAGTFGISGALGSPVTAGTITVAAGALVLQA